MKCIPAFKTAVLAALSADSGVQAIVGTNVFDMVPQKTPFAYVAMGPVGAQRAPEDCGGPAWSLRMRLYAASTKFGRDEPWTSIAAVDAALDGQVLTMPDGMAQILAIQTIAVGDVVSPLSPTQVFLDLTAIVAG